MTEGKVRQLLNDAAEDIDPGDRLASIRSATARRGGRTAWGWWVTGGAGMVAASVVTALVVSGGVNPQGSLTGPATTSTTRSSSIEGVNDTLAAVYYVGDTPDGPRLYREFRRVRADLVFHAALDAAVGRDIEGAPLAPLDPDYRVPWPAGTTIAAQVLPAVDSKSGGLDEVIEISLGGDVDLRERGIVSESEASLAIEQLIRTAQGAVSARVPVRFLLEGKVTDQVLGVSTAPTLTAGSSLDTLAHVSLSDPAEGRTVDNDNPLTVRGVGNSFEGNIVTRIQGWEDDAVFAQKPATAGWMEDRLFPFTVTFDLSNVPPGDYVVISSTDDPSGRGREHTDTRRISIMD